MNTTTEGKFTDHSIEMITLGDNARNEEERIRKLAKELSEIGEAKYIHEAYLHSYTTRENSIKKEISKLKGGYEQRLTLMKIFNKTAHPPNQPLSSSPIRMDAAATISPVRRRKSYAEAVKPNAEEQVQPKRPNHQSIPPTGYYPVFKISEYPTRKVVRKMPAQSPILLRELKRHQLSK